MKDLHYYVKWRGVRQGIDAEQPYENLEGTAMDALKELAKRWGLDENQFSHPNNLLADSWRFPDDRLLPPSSLVSNFSVPRPL